ncbi:hypothetical protein ACFVUH_05300 [Kitasatospora sp. NPDC058032]|uniref:hypothetical protein n=1 Tax=Kitasatospora sp. NPDC058032 TaxID=3346307 RepID=UPI0036DE4C07
MARSALDAYVALLDRSFVRIAEAAADGRTFDRATVARCADVWDNNTFPLSTTVIRRTALRRERAARAGLRWMAGLGEARYAWMVEQSAAAGHPVEGLIPVPPPDGHSPYRGYDGTLFPVTGPLTETAVDGYDLSRARLLRLEAELSGTRLRAALEVEVQRVCGPPEGDGAAGHPAPRLYLRLDDVSAAEFDAGPAVTGPLEWRADADGVDLRVAGVGLLRAARAALTVEDRYWHLTAAGRAADAATPVERRPARPGLLGRLGRNRHGRPPGPPFTVREGGAHRLAAALVHCAMLEIRMARFPGSASRRTILELCRVFEGAGTDLLAAARQGEEGGRALIERWVARGGDAWAGWFAEQLALGRRDGRTGEWAERLADRLRAVPRPVAEPRPQTEQAAVRLLLVRFAGHGYDPTAPASAVVHLAVPPEEAGPWELVVAKTERLERFRLDAAGFGATGSGTAAPVRKDGGRLTVGAGLALEWRSGESGQVGGGARESVHDVA